MDNAKLQELYKQSDANACLFKALATRDRPRATSDLRRLRLAVLNEQGVSLSWDTVLDFFKKLESFKIGKVILGKGVTPHRFRWSYNSIEVGRHGLITTTKENNNNKQASASKGKKTYVYPLRGDFIQLELPADLTKSEASDIASFLLGIAR